MARMSTGQKILLGAGILLLIDLFLPWECVDIFGGVDLNIPGVDTSGNVCINGFNGLGFLAGLLAIGLIVWEVMLAMGVAINMGTTSPALVSAILGGATALFAIIRFLQALGDFGFGAFVGILLALILAYGAYVRFQESKLGGTAPPPPVT